jgi:hypothetical protein
MVKMDYQDRKIIAASAFALSASLFIIAININFYTVGLTVKDLLYGIIAIINVLLLVFTIRHT